MKEICRILFYKATFWIGIPILYILHTCIAHILHAYIFKKQLENRLYVDINRYLEREREIILMIGTWTTFEDLKIICWLPVLFSSVHRCTRPFKALQEASLFSEDVFSIRVFTYVLQTHMIEYIAYETYI